MLPIDIQVNTAQTVEVGRDAQARQEAPGVLQSALAGAARKETDRQLHQVQQSTADQTTDGASEDGTGRGRAFLRQHGRRPGAEEEEEEKAPTEPGKGIRLDLKG